MVDYLGTNTVVENRAKLILGDCRSIHVSKDEKGSKQCPYCTEKSKKKSFVYVTENNTCSCCDKFIPIEKCRGIHSSRRDHNADAKMCPYCSEKLKREVWVETENGNTCSCCKIPIPQVKTYDVLRKIMNRFEEEHGYLLESWMPSKPSKESKTVVRVKHGMFTYETDIKWVGLFIEMQHMDRIPFPAPYDPEYKLIKRGGKAIERLESVSWDWQHGDDLPMKDAVKIQEMWESYERYNSIMRVINRHVVRLL